MQPRACTYGAFTGDLRLEDRTLVFVARGGQREVLGDLRDDVLYPDALTEPHTAYAFLRGLGLVTFQAGDRADRQPRRWRWTTTEE